MTTKEDVPREKELHSTVLSRIDASGGTLTALFNALHAAAEAGHHIESAEDRATDIDAHLDEAMRQVDSTNPDPEAVMDAVSGAASAAGKFRRGLDDSLRNFELPDHVDAGVYDTLGEYAKYVEQEVVGVEHYTEEWVAEAD